MPPLLSLSEANFETEKKLDERRERALSLLNSGKKPTEIAQVLGVHRATVHRWMCEPEFVAQRNQLMQELRAETRDRLFDLQALATDALADCLRSHHDATRLRAALAVFSMAEEQRIGETDASEIRRQREEDQNLLVLFQ